MGSLVWVEDLDEAWIDGEVVAVNGEDIKVQCTSGKIVSIFYILFSYFSWIKFFLLKLEGLQIY